MDPKHSNAINKVEAVRKGKDSLLISFNCNLQSIYGTWYIHLFQFSISVSVVLLIFDLKQARVLAM